ncbi:uncharacterized protein LOC143300583 [Babylonia areolata]|uniref:uncharacterized protein LOC143300583 n=1 Tax=Babylonia areolata TaxID=304850 RepID=UPI003FD1BAD6
MASKDPINNNSDDGGEPHPDRRPASHPSKEPLHLLPHTQDAKEIGVLRQVVLSAGLLASDGGLVLMQLVMLPTLQTLGVPVTSVTLPGCLSGSMALVGLPLLGCLSDRGSNPHGRKKPAVIFSALVFLAGFSLVISGCGLHTWLGPGAREVGGGQENASVIPPSSFFPEDSPTGDRLERTATPSVTGSSFTTTPSLTASSLAQPASFTTTPSLTASSLAQPASFTTTPSLTASSLAQPASFTTTPSLTASSLAQPASFTTTPSLTASSLAQPASFTTTPSLTASSLAQPASFTTTPSLTASSLAQPASFTTTPSLTASSLAQPASFTTTPSLTASSLAQPASFTAVPTAARQLRDDGPVSEETPPGAPSALDWGSGPTWVTPPLADESLRGPEEDKEDPSLPDWMADPLGLAIPLAGVLAILGFAFIDMGNDLNNSSQKSFVLGCTRPAQHVSLLVVGVQMSALGGCVAAILGVTDLASYLTRGTILDAVPGKSMLQCGIFICLTLLCVLTTLLSAPSPPHPHGKASLSDVTSPKHPSYGTIEEGPGRAHQRAASSSDLLTDSGALPVADDALHSSDHHCDSHSHRSSHESGSIAFSRLDLSVSDYHLASSCESCMSSDIVRLLESGSVHERRSRHPPRTENSATTEQESRRAKLFASNSIVYYAIEDHGSVSAERDSERGERDPEHAAELSPSCRRGSRWCSRSTRRLALICMSMFFMCGAWQSFNVCTTDYLGKVIYRGDPDADPDSQSYTAYQQGMRTGSSGVLLLNGVYVVVNFMQKKVLTVAGPKIECLVVCGLQVGSLIALLMTNNVMVYYVTSTAVGIFRSAMYTIPFMLANEICQEEARAGGGEGQANVGSTMALVTSMIPLSNILVSSMTGPLIFSTGNPASPLYYTIAATFVAGVVFVFT